jgi:hypothetical protein
MSRPKHITETRFEFLKRSATEHEASDTRHACLIWPFAISDGYGVIAWPRWPDLPQAKVTERVHRIAYLLHNGALPEPHGLHTCDDTLCYNWRHVYAGGDVENAADRVARGLARGPKGESNAAAKLNTELVLQMRKESATMSQVDLVAKYRVGRYTVRRVLTGELWTHVPMPPETRQCYKDAYGVNDGSKKLTPDDVRVIRASALTHRELSAVYRVSRLTIGRIIRRERWKHVT